VEMRARGADEADDPGVRVKGWSMNSLKIV